MKRISLSGDEKTVMSVWNWYEAVLSILLRDKSRIRASVATVSGDLADVPDLFVGMTVSEIDTYYSDKLQELDWVTCLELLAATEAALRVDFHVRVDKRLKDGLTRRFRDVRKEYEDRPHQIRLVEDILDNWRDDEPDKKTLIGDFKGALKLRHWLAHGRYRTPKLGRTYDPMDIYQVSSTLLTSFGLV